MRFYLRSLFIFDQSYNDNLKKYTYKDGLCAGLLFVLFMLLYSLVAYLEINAAFVKDNVIVAGCLCNAVIIGCTLVIVKLNKQDIDTVGLKGGKIKQSCIAGIILGIILFFGNCGMELSQGKDLIEAWKIFIYVMYFMLVALCEEIAFRGYINTRLCGIIKNPWVAIIVSGVLFIVMHLPYRMIAGGLSAGELLLGNPGWVIDLFVTHIVLTLIYSKTNSLYGSIIPHWISDLAYKIVVH